MQRALALLSVVLLTGSCAAGTGTSPTGGICHAGETTYFQCSTAHHKSLGLCGNLPSTLQYRYGKPGKVELQFPDQAADGAKLLLYAHYHRYQTDRSEVTFSHAGVDYAVFDYTESGKRSAGVHVTTADGAEHEVLCDGAIHGRLDALKNSLRCDADNALNGGNCP